LSKDQTGFNEAEIARIDAEHPGEPNVIDSKTGRVLGIMVSRAFGDGLWKWPLEVILECKEKFFWKAPRPGYKTPPYLTAEPVVTTTQIRGNDEFMILASDGLWDHLSNEQAVKLVEMWLVAQKEGTIGKTARRPQAVGKVTTKTLYGDERMKDKDFTVEDQNVATHLVRNALGGADTEKLCGLVGVQPPLAREVRDDITVQVVFFDAK
jgi:pyruvate dehydrogenase phosphatase